MSFDAPDGTDPAWVAARLNKRLGPELAVRAAVDVPDSFDARFSAQRRTYEYRLYRSVAPDPFRDRFALHAPQPLDVRAMRAAAKAFVGEHDFRSFCRAGQTSTLRRIRSLTISTAGDEEIVIRIIADSFCHQMVRSIVGFLLDVGRGRRPFTETATALAARVRSAAGPVAPAKGLTLVSAGFRREPFQRIGSRLGVAASAAPLSLVTSPTSPRRSHGVR